MSLKRSATVLSRSDTIPLPKRAKTVVAAVVAPARKRPNYRSAKSRAQRVGLYRLPFPKEARFIMEWVGTPAYITPAAQTWNYSLIVNSAGDVDTGTSFGTNRTVNHWTSLFTVNGPYKTYVVEKWVTTVQFTNAGSYPCNAFMLNSTSSSDGASLTQMTNYNIDRDRDLTHGQLTAATGSRSTITLSLPGSLASMVNNPNDVSYAGAYSTAPSNLVFTNILLDQTMTANNITVYVAPRITMYLKAWNYDSTQ